MQLRDVANSFTKICLAAGMNSCDVKNEFAFRCHLFATASECEGLKTETLTRQFCAIGLAILVEVKKFIYPIRRNAS